MADAERKRLSAEFWDTHDKMDELRDRSSGLRKKYDDLSNRMMEELRELGDQIKEARQPLVEYGKRLADLNRALGNKAEPRAKK